MISRALRVRKRRAGALVVPLAAVVALTGCGGGKDKGSDLPSVTLSSGNSKVTSTAVSYLQDGKLHQASPGLLSLAVQPGATVTIKAPSEVAARGWQVQLDDKIVIERSKEQTATLKVPTNLSGRQPLVTILAAPVGSSNRASGLWVFRLSPPGS